MSSGGERRADGAASGGRLARFRKPALLLGPGVLVVLILAITMSLAKRPAPPQTDAPPVNVKVVTIVPVKKLPDTFDIPGVVEPRRVVRVSAEVAGRVEAIDVEEGQPCRKGDVMLRLNTELLSAAHDRAKATAEFDGREYERMLGLSERGVATSSELDQVRSRAAASQAAMEEAKAKLDRATIAAPTDGIINRVPIEAGEYVQEGALVAELVDIDAVKVVVDVPERDLPYLTVGQQDDILPDPRGKPLTGTITYIGKIADQATRTTPIEITVDNTDRRLYSGQIVVARLLRRVIDDAVMIPLEAVIPLEDGKEVYVVEGGKAASRRVALGVMKGTTVQITSGLAAGDELIVDGHRYAAPGQAVRIVEHVGGKQTE